MIYFQDEVPNNFTLQSSDNNPPDNYDDEEALDMDEYEESGLLDADDDVIILSFLSLIWAVRFFILIIIFN